VTEGALVGQNEATPLAIIQQLDPIHADLTQSTRELNELRRAFRAGSLKQVGQDQAKATLIQDDGSLYPLPGKLLFAEISVDPGTGQIIVRSEFPNPDLDLLPGQFCARAPGTGVDAKASACRNARSPATAPASRWCCCWTPNKP